MVHVILCMHAPLLEALCELSEQLLKAPLRATCVGHGLEEPEREIYQALDEQISSYQEGDVVLVLGDLLGSRSATVAMSIPHPSVTYLGGVNLPLLLELNGAIEWAHSLSDLSPREQVIALVERLTALGRAGVLDSHSCLRPDGEDSQIDSSYYEGSVFGMSALSQSEGGA